jgi:uncharacterized protein (DUF427 family)
LNDVGGGVVTKILNKEIVLVKNNDDWEIPCRISELIPDVNAFYSPEERMAEEKRQQVGNSKAKLINKKIEEEEELELVVAGRSLSNISSQKASETNDNQEVEGEQEELRYFIWDDKNPSKKSDKIHAIFAFIPSEPANPENSDLEAFLINDSEYDLFYQFAITFKGKEIVRDSGLLEAETKIYLESYKRQDLNELTGIRVQLLALNPGGSTLPPTEIAMGIQSVKFFKSGSYTDNDYFDEKGILFDLKQAAEKKELVESLEKLKVSQQKDVLAENQARQEKQLPAHQEIPVVDLHIEQLSQRHDQMNNIEIFNLQMDTFRIELQRAFAARMPKIVFIHGVGNSILKQEITNELVRKHKAFRFQDASFREYGYGATLVYLNRNPHFKPSSNKKP